MTLIEAQDAGEGEEGGEGEREGGEGEREGGEGEGEGGGVGQTAIVTRSAQLMR